MKEVVVEEAVVVEKKGGWDVLCEKLCADLVRGGRALIWKVCEQKWRKEARITGRKERM